jgi:8-oxo-dGTP pyrophosphatase MutT (NUDIX family)
MQGGNAPACFRALPRSLASWRRLLQQALAIPKEDVVRPAHCHIVDVVSNACTERDAGVPKASEAFRKSAVLVLVHPVASVVTAADASRDTFVDMNILLTLRCSKMRTHGGQMSFPGGRLDDKETVVQAASRECMEEVGVLDDNYDVLGTLSPVWSHPSKSWVTPVVAIAQQEIFPQIRSFEEVESIHYLNVPNLLCNSSRTHHQLIKHWAAFGTFRFPCFFASEDPSHAATCWRDASALTVHPGAKGNGPLAQIPIDHGLTPVSIDECDGQLVWGLTAAMIAELVARLATAQNAIDSASSIRLACSGFLVRDPEQPEDVAGRSKL